MTEPEALTLEPRPMGGILAFYAAIWSELRSAATRWHLAIVVEVAMILAWFVIRTAAGVDGRAYLLWVIAAGILAVLWPMSGLVVFVATSVFYEPDNIPRDIPIRILVLIPLAAGVLIRIAADRFRWRPSLAVWLALALLVGTALGVVVSFDRFPDDVAWRAARSWFNNMAGPVILLIAAVWTARGGSTRVLVVACIVAVVSAAVALAEYASPGLFSVGRFDWVGFWKDFGARLAGTIPSPNALSAQLIVPTAVLGAAVLLARDLRLKALALVGLVPLLARPLPDLQSVAAPGRVRLRRRRRVACSTSGSGSLCSSAASSSARRCCPATSQLRARRHPGRRSSPARSSSPPTQYRFQAWGAAVAMWADEPLIGQGYLAYKALGPEFGDPLLGSPHNEWLRFFAEEGTIVGLVGIAFVVSDGLVARARSRAGSAPGSSPGSSGMSSPRRSTTRSCSSA